MHRPSNAARKVRVEKVKDGKEAPSQLHVVINGTVSAKQQQPQKTSKSPRSASGTAAEVERLAVVQGPANKREGMSSTKSHRRLQ